MIEKTRFVQEKCLKRTKMDSSPPEAHRLGHNKKRVRLPPTAHLLGKILNILYLFNSYIYISSFLFYDCIFICIYEYFYYLFISFILFLFMLWATLFNLIDFRFVDDVSFTGSMACNGAYICGFTDGTQIE